MAFSKEALFNIEGMSETSGTVTRHPRGKVMICFK
jgi:hypothetical protein